MATFSGKSIRTESVNTGYAANASSEWLYKASKVKPIFNNIGQLGRGVGPGSYVTLTPGDDPMMRIVPENALRPGQQVNFFSNIRGPVKKSYPIGGYDIPGVPKTYYDTYTDGSVDPVGARQKDLTDKTQGQRVASVLAASTTGV